MVKNNVEKLAVLLVLNMGGVQVKDGRYSWGGWETNIYGDGCPVIDDRETKKAKAKLVEHGIDWKLTEDSRQESSSVFEGTDADNSTTYYHYVDVYCKNGESWRFAHKFNMDRLGSLCETMKNITEENWAEAL